MDTLFLTCAIFGGTVLVAQFFLGFGDDHDAGGDDSPDVVDLGDTTASAEGHADQPHDPHHTTWLFGVLSFRTIMIGLTFFGLTGEAANAAEFDRPWPLLVGAACGLGAMYGVYFLMRGLNRLTADGTERIGRAVGEEGMVYLTIPAQNSGLGKVHVALQNRTVELEAMTAGDRLPTGTRVIVVGVMATDRVAVEAIPETVPHKK